MLKRLGAFFLDIIQVVVFAVAIFLFVYLLILQPHKIKGNSMQPNFPDGEYLLTDKVSYRFGEPERGDVIVFEPPGSQGEEFIKRIVGLPGEVVSLRDNRFYINGLLLNEHYIALDVPTQPGNYLAEGTQITVPQEQYFVLGDNRTHSSDSRVFGPISKDKITGRAWVVYWPPSLVGVVEEISY